MFKEFNNNSEFNNYTIPDIILNKIGNHTLNNDLLLNDIIKCNENKIYYCFTDSNKENIYIISIYLNNNKYKIRYYLINIIQYGMQYKIYQEMRMHNYNNFIAFAFSHNDNPYYSSLLIFSYPNSTDYNLSLIQKLFENSNHSDIYINLENEKKPKIENNIFGYVFSGIIVSDLDNCDNLDLISSNSNTTIGPNCTLPINGSIKLGFNNNYTKFICNIQYSYKVTEPDLECYNRYIEYYDGDNETDDQFNDEKTEYIGRLNYYNISLNESLIEDCKDPNCKLCLGSNSSFCIICKYNNTFSDYKKTKICLEQVIMIGGIEVIKRDLKETKEDFVIEIDNVIKSIDINKNYEMKGDDYTVMIRPTNSTPILSSTHVDFGPCENILRAHYNISNSRIITFLQLEINNLDSQSVVNQVGYQAFDDEQKPLNLSL